LIPRLKLVGGIFINALVRKEYDEKINALIEQLKSDNIYLQKEIHTHHSFEEIIGKSHELKYILHQVEQIATRRTPVLLIGETGTGKELVARAIHQISDRKDRPMIKVNCAALPAALIESELFGHEKGTFTSAHQQQIGRFEYADGATIFLDEIGELPLDLQPKLLRVLQDGEFERLGNPCTIKVDVRVIAATNKDIEEAVKSGQFRQDLFYRINVFPISIPPLRERREDIPLMVNAVVQKYSNEMGKQFGILSKQVIENLQNYSWPGNVRELENVMERAVILSHEPDLQIDLPEHPVVDASKGKTLENIERSHILRILKDTNWKIKGVNGAAEILGINPSTLRDRIEKLGIERPHTTTR
jgi:transcriptional regulator with GAF, ATPase, and Fis domain